MISRFLFLSAVLILVTSIGSSAPANDGFSKPYPEQKYSSFKLLGADGSAARKPREDWAGARALVATDPAWKKWAAEQGAALDAWIGRNRDRAEWEAGWYHEFISPVDGSPIVWTASIPGEQAKTLRSRTGHDVEITPTLFRSWIGAFRKNHTLRMTEAGRYFLLSGEARYGDWVAAQLDFYADHYTSWGKGVAQKDGSHLGYQSLDDATLTSNLVEAARLVFDHVSPARRQAWFDRLFKPQAELLDHSFQFIHNIATWQRATQAQIALLYHDETLLTRAMDGPNGLRAQLRRGVTSDYFWYEQSMGYNDFIVTATTPLFTAAGLIGQGDQLREEAGIVENLLLAPLFIRFPDNTLPNPADNNGIARVPSEWLGRAYRIWPTHLGLTRAVNARSWDTLVDPPTAVAASLGIELKSESPLPEIESLSLESTRFAQFKQGPWQVFFHYGQLLKSHAQAEALSWQAWYGDAPLSTDPGTIGYGSALHREYYVTGLNHNVPLVDGDGQVSWHPGNLLRFEADGLTPMMSAEQPEYRPDAAARRSLRIENGSLVEETTLKLKQPGEANTRRIGLSLHLQGTPRLGAGFQMLGTEDFARDRPPAFKHWKNVSRGAFQDRAAINVELATGAVLRVEFSVAGGGAFTLSQGTAPNRPGQTRAGFYLELEPGRDQATFVTTFTPLSETKSP